jgi:hypothetical protein
MCQFAGEALQFYKKCGRRGRFSSNKRAQASAIGGVLLKSGVERSIADTSCAVTPAVHGGDRAPVGARWFPKPRLT